MPRVRGKTGSIALELRFSQPKLIRYRQVLLPRLNHDVTSVGIRVCKGRYADPDTERDRLQSR
jgi:hypothetical protein